MLFLVLNPMSPLESVKCIYKIRTISTSYAQIYTRLFKRCIRQTNRFTRRMNETTSPHRAAVIISLARLVIGGGGGGLCGSGKSRVGAGVGVPLRPRVRSGGATVHCRGSIIQQRRHNLKPVHPNLEILSNLIEENCSFCD